MNWKLRLRAGDKTPIYQQIETAIRAAIEAGQLKSGDRIPSVVDLADKLGVNKLTVVKAFQKLEKSGLLRLEVGRGTFVAGGENGLGTLPGPEPKPEVTRSIRRLREGYARGLRELMAVERRPDTINLSGGVPSPATVPDGLLQRLCAQVLANNPRRLYEYSGPEGMPELREAIATRLVADGTTVARDEIIVTNGSQQALSLAALMPREEGRVAICETPSYAAVPQLFMLYGQVVQSVPRQGGALNFGQLAALSSGRRVVLYVCPDFQNPTGETMSTVQRQQLADWAARNDALVIDDEIFRDLRMEGKHPPSLYSMLPPGRRILVSSISKSFMTGLRTGFLAADRAIVSELMLFKRYIDLGGPSLTQAIAAAFLKDGYDKHLEKMRSYYRSRRDAALAALSECMPKGVSWTHPQGGFQHWVTMPQQASSIQLFLQAIERGVAIVPGPAHDVDGGCVNSFRLGYGNASPEEIRIGVGRLAEIIGGMLARRPEAGSPGGLGIII